MLVDKPRVPLPDPLCGREPATFTQRSILDRLPRIAVRTMAENAFSQAAQAEIEQLVSEIPNGPVRPLVQYGPENRDWPQFIEPYLGQDWLEPPWFFIEHYFYQRILEASGYFKEGTGKGLDPFGQQKQQGLNAALDPVRALGQQVDRLLSTSGWREEDLAGLLATDLWGNQADLSMWPDGKIAEDNMIDRSDFTLIDDSAEATAYLKSNSGLDERIDVLVDNAGFEVAADLLLVLYLLEKNIAGRVDLHVKPHPTFVSDAMMGDIWRTMSFIGEAKDQTLAGIGLRLVSHLNSGRLVLTTSSFWTSPLPSWQMPPDLKKSLGQATLVISKGDAHYRRLLGDRHWPYQTPISEVLNYWPSTLLALRTLKSEVAAGIPAERLQTVQQRDPEWLVNGEWGIIQFVPKDPQELSTAS